MRVEHYFPLIDDPDLILKALNDWRPEWDNSMSIISELTEFRSSNTQVHRLVNKAVLGTQQREFIDKKFFFTAEDSSIYMWVTSAPDNVFPLSA